eukprot:m.26150 g.26150  ORF g.26150 m.26150 type:complete len:480 (+) comp8799_c1_seq1:18-1457(+)
MLRARQLIARVGRIVEPCAWRWAHTASSVELMVQAAQSRDGEACTAWWAGLHQSAEKGTHQDTCLQVDALLRIADASVYDFQWVVSVLQPVAPTNTLVSAVEKAISNYSTTARGNDCYVAIDTLSQTLAKPPTVQHYQALMEAFARANNGRAVSQMIRRMEEEGLAPSSNEYALLFRTATGKKGDRAITLWKKLELQGTPKDETLYTAYITSLAKSNLVEEAEYMLKQMEKTLGIAGNAKIYAQLCSAYCFRGNPIRAEECLLALEKQPLDSKSMGTILKAPLKRLLMLYATQGSSVDVAGTLARLETRCRVSGTELRDLHLSADISLLAATNPNALVSFAPTLRQQGVTNPKVWQRYLRELRHIKRHDVCISVFLSLTNDGSISGPVLNDALISAVDANPASVVSLLQHTMQELGGRLKPTPTTAGLALRALQRLGNPQAVLEAGRLLAEMGFAKYPQMNTALRNAQRLQAIQESQRT